ncbi:MAG: hypothetical protein ACR2NZ_23120 [Rubripirellula sp.]
MSLEQILIPDSIRDVRLPSSAEKLIDEANDRIEAFMLADQKVIENFVTCDFWLAAQALCWIEEQHLLTGDRFLEFGSGFGVAAMLAALRGMEAVGIEIEPELVDQASSLADDLSLDAKFFAGSFVPRDTSGLIEAFSDVRHVETEEGDVYDEIGLELEDFDLFFAYPWPGEHTFFEAVFESGAPVGSMLLTYRGREGMNLVRKTA